jgi:hypothetical protein
MAIKKLQNNYTTPEQSKRLLELGVPADSADCAYRGPFIPITILSPNELYSEHEKEVHDLETKRDRREGRFQTCEPCWSVGRLIEIFSKCYTGAKCYYSPRNLYKIEFWMERFNRLNKIGFMDFSKLEDN